MNRIIKSLLAAGIIVQMNLWSGKTPLQFKYEESPVKPAWLAEPPFSGGNKEKTAFTLWKPILVTAAAGGITYALYSIRSKS